MRILKRFQFPKERKTTWQKEADKAVKSRDPFSFSGYIIDIFNCLARKDCPN